MIEIFCIFSVLSIVLLLGTHPIPGMSDDPSGFTQSLFISTDIRTSREFADVEGLDGRLSPGFGAHLSPPSSPHDKRSPKKKLGVVMNIKSLGRDSFNQQYFMLVSNRS